MIIFYRPIKSVARYIYHKKKEHQADRYNLKRIQKFTTVPVLSSSSEGAMCMWIGDGGSEPVAPPSPQISLKSLSLRLRDKIVDVSGWCITICISCIDISVIDLSGKKSTQKIIIYVSYFYTTNKVIHPKYSKHWPYTLAPKIDCGCSKMLNHGLNHGFFLSLFKLIPRPIHWIVCVLAYLNFIFEF